MKKYIDPSNTFILPLTAAIFLLILLSSLYSHAQDPVKIGSRRELFVDNYLINEMKGAELQLHHPTTREVVINHDEPWEGSGSGYHSIFKDGDIYRMYYKSWQLEVKKGKLNLPHKLYACYAESKDGIHWEKPNLGIVEFKGSFENNIIMAPDTIDGVRVDPGHISVFKDANPNCEPDAKYKALIRSANPKGLLAYQSSDGIHWSLMHSKPIITEGAFDSQNLAFWDDVRKEYRAYIRDFRNGIRGIKTCTSKDFINWTKPVWIEYRPERKKEHLYTNQIKPYYRAPHILMGFPARYTERSWSKSMEALPQPDHRRMRSSIRQRYGTALTEGLFMTSRDGQTFKRWEEAFLRPGPEREDTWKYGDNYIAWHIVETASSIPSAPDELSIYATEGYWTGESNQLRRYTLRIDGFVSLSAPMKGGEVTTKPFIFSGNHLEINFSTSAAGSIRIELQDENGKPISGFTLEDCPEIYGDALERTVEWNSNSDLSKLAGKPVRMRIVLKDADLYSFKFIE